MADQFDLSKFVLERVINEDPHAHSITLLGYRKEEGSSQDAQNRTIVRMEKTALPAFSDNLVARTEPIDSNDIYSWLSGWLKTSQTNPDLKIYVICPATDTHIRKYSKQSLHVVRESPEIYAAIVKPYIDAFPSARIQWIDDIISGIYEVDKVLFRTPPSELSGFLILPDMKWDARTLTSLYLVAIALQPTVKSLRDLGAEHLPMLKSIRREAERVVREKWGLAPTELRLFVHYQPSYYHFHVHIVNVNYTSLPGMAVGQAHLLDDIITLLEVDGSIFQKMTLTYSLGENHGLFLQMLAAQIQ